MKTVRLGDELEECLETAARVTGEPESKIIRDAVREHCNDLLQHRLRDRLANVIGVVSSNGGDSRRTGRQMTELLSRKHKRRQ
ncbi:MAG TPA: hypothetical protein VFG91_09480 [Woeseiaceae bacterium]|nr:hypothetical protein [Woeseiaceae bacterium]